MRKVNISLILCLLVAAIVVTACNANAASTQESLPSSPVETQAPTSTSAPETAAPAATETPIQAVVTPQPTTIPTTEADGEPILDVQPAKALADEPVIIQASSLEPGQLITLTASMRDDYNRNWQSSAAFIADEGGIVDVATQAPITGTYTTADPMGLFWSMQPVAAIPSTDYDFFANWYTVPRMVTIKAEVEGKQVAMAYTERVRLKEDVTVTPFTEDGLVGYLFTPDAEGTHPALLVLGGSGGGIDSAKAAMLASHGYVTLALDYFGDPPLPAELVEIPLEYFKTAIDWLQAQENVDAEKIGVVGVSRGGELALLLGATYPEITAVVGYVPSGLVINGISRTNPGEKSAWTLNGTPVPFYVKSEENLEESAIPVEQINGPILLISAKDDQTWPSTALSEIAIERLQENDHPYPYEHLSYEGAGHMISLPYWPTTGGNAFDHPVYDDEVYFMGGTPQGDAAANVDSWARVLAFLADAFGEPAP